MKVEFSWGIEASGPLNPTLSLIMKLVEDCRQSFFLSRMMKSWAELIKLNGSTFCVKSERVNAFSNSFWWLIY
jgi:hypothetical protein